MDTKETAIFESLDKFTSQDDLGRIWKDKIYESSDVEGDRQFAEEATRPCSHH